MQYAQAMLLALTGAATASALLAIAAEEPPRRRPAFYVLKPLTTVLIGAVAALGPADALQAGVLAALALCLLGDICLMFPGNRWFLAGLGSFLLAHGVFAWAFLRGIDAPVFPAWLAVVALAAVALLAWLLPRAGALRLPVAIYTLAIGAMVATAAARHQALASEATLLMLCGALLFMVSDACLAVRQFVGRYRYAQPLILTAYWTALGLIAWSV